MKGFWVWHSFQVSLGTYQQEVVELSNHMEAYEEMQTVNCPWICLAGQIANLKPEKTKGSPFLINLPGVLKNRLLTSSTKNSWKSREQSSFS